MSCHALTQNISEQILNLEVCPGRTSGTDHTFLQQKLVKVMRKLEPVHRKTLKRNRKKKKKNIGYSKTFCVTRKFNKLRGYKGTNVSQTL